MRRWLRFPRTITGQITLLIGASLLVANLITIGTTYFLLTTSARTPPVVSVRAATVAQLARAAASARDVEAITALAQRIGIEVRPVSRAELRAARAGNAPGFLERRALDRFLAITGLDAQRDHVIAAPGHTIAVELPDDNGLAFPYPDGGGFGVSRFIVAPIVYILSAIAAVLICLSLYAARFITAPLSSFAEAAYSIGRTRNNGKIAERGPVEIVRVAEALNEMRGRITALLDERVGMLTAISHDLRTPLTRIRLRAERLTHIDAAASLGDGMLTDIVRMEQMLAETLTYMRDTTGAEPMLPVDLPSVLETICVELADLGKDISYQGPARLVFRCQAGALTRAITNLVDNGLKYGNAVKVELQEANTGAVTIEVSDNGPGIPYSMRARVFEPFFKADAARTASDMDGFGLGLAIVSNVIKAHNGEIDLLPIAPHGTRVRVILPRAPLGGDMTETVRDTALRRRAF